MKHLKNFENYSEKDVRYMLSKSLRKKDIEIKTSIDNVIDNLQDTNSVKLIGTFKGFVYDEGRFISEGDKKRMPEYIQEFKKLGLDTSKVEKLSQKYQRDVQLTYDISDFRFSSSNQNEYDKLYDERDSLEADVKEFQNEIRRLAKEAKELL